MTNAKLFPELDSKIEKLKGIQVPEGRQKVLRPLINFIQKKKDQQEKIQLNFICTHNSRRSQLGQVWAKAISEYYGIKTECFSGGTEATAFFSQAINSLKKAGFKIETETGENPEYKVFFSEEHPPLSCYSKKYDHLENPSENFAAILTCSHADENCPFISGCEVRVPLDYEDPKKYDNTAEAAFRYDERSNQIAGEMIYVFKNIK